MVYPLDGFNTHEFGGRASMSPSAPDHCRRTLKMAIMKKKAVLRVLTAGLLAGLAVQGVHAASLKDIQERGYVRIAVANEIPYGYMDMQGNAMGAGPDVAKHVMQQLGVKEIRWETTNFGSLIPGLRANRFDMVAAEMAVLPQRCQQVLFSEPNSSYGEGLLVAKGNPEDVHRYEDFAES